MSGVESAAGLAIGVVALASLFSTCIELLDYWEDGRNYIGDFDKACTKVAILQQRLGDWGAALHIDSPGREHPTLREPAKRDAVRRSLLQLSALLSDSEGLKRKYSLVAHCDDSTTTRKASTSSRVASWSSSLRRRTAWTIRDKVKFDQLISDISFLIENMEKVTIGTPSRFVVGVKSVSRPRRVEEEFAQQQLSRDHGVTDSESESDQDDTEDAAVTEGGGRERQALIPASPSKTSALAPYNQDSRSQGRRHRRNADEHYDSPHRERLSGSKSQKPLLQKGHQIDGRQCNKDNSFGLQGFVEPSGGKWYITGEQHNSGNACGIQGGGNIEGLLRLQQATYGKK